LHSVGWLHKSFRSENILFFNDADQDPHLLTQPYVCGFDFSRQDSPHEMTENVPSVLMNMPTLKGACIDTLILIIVSSNNQQGRLRKPSNSLLRTPSKPQRNSGTKEHMISIALGSCYSRLDTGARQKILEGGIMIWKASGTRCMTIFYLNSVTACLLNITTSHSVA
jgi:hypothetical protein